MSRRARVYAGGAIAAAVVALLLAMGQRDEPIPESVARPSAQASASAGAALAPLLAPQHPPLEPVDPPKSGLEKLKWLRENLGHTYASLTLFRRKLRFLRSLTNPDPAQLQELENLAQRQQQLEEKFRRQKDELENFDIDAPPEADNPYGGKGPPVKVSAALQLSHAQWNALAAKHLGPEQALSPELFETLDGRLRDERDILAALSVPASLAPKVQEEFLLVVEGLLQSETMTDSAAAKSLLEGRWREFLTRVRGLGAPPPS
jgi:hypothetical protein